MNLYQTLGEQAWVSRKASSKRPIKRLAYEGAILVPMAVPFNCWYVWPSKVKKLWVRMKLARVIRKELLDRVAGGCSERKYSIAARPWACGILVYKEVASMVTRMVSGGKGSGKDLRRSRKWLVSLMKEGRLLVMGCRCWST